MLTKLVVAVAVSLSSSAALADTTKNMDFVSCDNSQWSAYWKGNNFHFVPHQGDAQHVAHDDKVIVYKAWDNGCWEASWDAKAKEFVHKSLPNGPSHKDAVIGYITWDGSRWSATRWDNQFVNTPGPSK